MAIEIRKGTKEDVEDFIAFLARIRAQMDHPEWFYLDSPQEVRRLMESGVMQLWLAVDGSRIAGIYDYLVPGEAPYNYGYDLDFSREQLLRVINMDNAAVHPDYRGLGLQRRMMQVAEESLRDTGHWHLLCTIHPDNRYSLQNAQAMGYTIQKELPKYGSTRYILRKDIF